MNPGATNKGDRPLSRKAREFLQANEQSPVVSGAAIGNGGQGCRYTLKDGRKFTLGRKACEEIGYPRWDLDQ